MTAVGSAKNKMGKADAERPKEEADDSGQVGDRRVKLAFTGPILRRGQFWTGFAFAFGFD